MGVHPEHYVPMDTLAKKLKEKAERLGISNAAVARRVGLEERRYAHYAAGRREPDLKTLVTIARALDTTPNDLLGFEGSFLDDQTANAMVNRFVQAASNMTHDELELCVVQAEAVAARSRQRSGH